MKYARIEQAISDLTWLACGCKGYEGDAEAAVEALSFTPVEGLAPESMTALIDELGKYADVDFVDVGGSDWFVWKVPTQQYHRTNSFYVMWLVPDTASEVYVLSLSEVRDFLERAEEIVRTVPDEEA